MRPWVRLVLAISLDGRLAFPSRGAAHLGGGGDRRVLEEALGWSDGTLMGGGTLSAHRSTCLIHAQNLIDDRLMEGRSEQPISLVVSRGKQLSADWPFFRQPIRRWLLVPRECSSDASLNINTPVGFERQFPIEDDWNETLEVLSHAGLSRLVLLGGAKLVGSFLKADSVDELQLTLAPRILGGEYSWVPTAINDLPLSLQDSGAWRLQAVEPLDDNELMVRYFRIRLLD